MEKNEDLFQDQKDTCFYCEQYADLSTNFPVNPGTYSLNDDTLRCYLHYQFKCDACKTKNHFNGTSWCHNCQKFTCIRCSSERVVEQQFLIYEYYYIIPCKFCEISNPALDFAEYKGIHPFQIGDIRPNETIRVYVPLGDEPVADNFPHPSVGSQRILRLTNSTDFYKASGNVSSIDVWNKLADNWTSLYPKDVDYHHKNIIHPHMIELIGPNEGEKICDIACGEGSLTRKLARSGAKLWGFDPSNMLDHAINRSQGYNIRYEKYNVHNLYKLDMLFDKVSCNMALMDIDNLTSVLSNISSILKEGGTFTFSITHPAFSWPVLKSLRLPRDSHRNDDKIYVVDNYFDENPTRVKFDEHEDWLYYPRKISTYINELVKHGFTIIEMREPEVSEEMKYKFPRNSLYDDDRLPNFMVIKTKKVR